MSGLHSALEPTFVTWARCESVPQGLGGMEDVGAWDIVIHIWGQTSFPAQALRMDGSGLYTYIFILGSL